MKSFSLEKLAETVLAQRKALHITQQDLAAQTGINRSLLSRLEKQDYIPAPDQMVRLANALSFDPSVAFIDVMDPVCPWQSSFPVSIMLPSWMLSRRRWKWLTNGSARSRMNTLRNS